MEHVTLAELQSGALQQVEVYVARFGKCVTLRELTGPEVFEAGKLSTAPVAGTEAIQRVDVAKRRALLIAFALVEPSLGRTLVEKAAQVETILSLAYIDQLLLDSVQDLLSGGTLTAEQMEVLKSPLPPAKMLEALGTDAEDTAFHLEQQSEEDLAAIMSAALHGYAGALTGSMSMSLIRLVARAAREQEQRQAREIAEALAQLVVPQG